MNMGEPFVVINFLFIIVKMLHSSAVFVQTT